jgi:exodeoxyribonuclease VII small subunit
MPSALGFREGAMDQDAPERAIEDLSFEEALAELEALVRRLEDGKITLDESISGYERGTALKQRCETLLQEAQSRVETIVLRPDGGVATETSELDRGAGDRN